jgi:hypothetical protein
MSSTVEFFNPESPFSADLTGWEIQTVNPAKTKQRAQQLGKNGDEIASQTHGGQTAITAEFTATESTAAIPAVGIVENGWHIDSLQVRYVNNDFVKMSITMHKHDGTTHADGSCRTYKGSLATVGVTFGCPATIPGITIPEGAGVRSFTYSLSCHHVDEPNRTGGWLAGDNYDGAETSEVELCDAGTVSAAANWDLMADNGQKGNTIAETHTATAEHHIAHSNDADELDLVDAA